MELWQKMVCVVEVAVLMALPAILMVFSNRRRKA
jgi:hypothetical protein